jgi:putative ABC transport system permease protein
MRGFLSDIRYAFRTLRHSRISTVVAVLSLAVGVGANAAIFSVGYAMLARPLPYPDADRLVMLRSTNPSHGVLWTTTAEANLLDWQSQAKSFEAIAGYRWWSVDLTGGDRSERLRGLFITPDFFKVLRVPLMGNTFEPNGALNPGGSRPPRSEIILGQGLWKRRFGSDTNLPGKRIDVNIINLSRVGPTPFSVTGIARTDVHFPPLSASFNLDVAGIGESIDFWIPESRDVRRDSGDLDVIARLRPGVPVEQAQAEMDTISRNLAAAYPETNTGLGVQVVVLRDHVLGASRRVLLLLFACTALVLLVACGNVANLLLVRATTRHKEVAIRAALGAARLRIVRQFLAESALIALPGAALGVALAYSSLLLLRPLIPAGVPLAEDATIDRSVLLFTLIIALLTTFVTGIIPALRVSSADPGDAMKRFESRSSTAGRGRHRVVAILVASEVAMTLLLLIATGLMIKSANRLWQVDPGFDTTNLLTMTISLPNNKFEWRHNVVFSHQVIDSIKMMPAVREAAVIQGVPMQAGGFYTAFTVEGRSDIPVDRSSATIRVVSPEYFRLMQIPILSGRGYNEQDQIGEVGSLPSVIINRRLAEHFWPGQNAVGKKIRMSWKDTPSLIIGVVGDVRYTGLDQAPGDEFYIPDGLYPESAMTLLVRTDRDPLPLYSEMRRRISEIDKDAFVSDIKPMTQIIAESLAPRRFSTILLSAFAGIALILALTGIYGVIAHSVAQRTVEIGIRMAVGASPARVTGLMLRFGLLPALCGIAVGWTGAIAISRLFTAMLFGVSALDPSTWLLVTGSMLAVASLASYLPARRASRVDPTVALRSE